MQHHSTSLARALFNGLFAKHVKGHLLQSLNYIVDLNFAAIVLRGNYGRPRKRARIFFWGGGGGGRC